VLGGASAEFQWACSSRREKGRLTMGKEQRCNPRFECSGAAGVQIERDADPSPARIVNLSLDGCLIVLQKPLSLSQDTIVELTFTINDQPFRVWGRVRAIRSDTTVGFHFPLLCERVRTRIASLIEQLIDDLLSKDTLTCAEEQRRYPRIACNCTAGIRMAAGEAFVPASVVNLSAGGCLMILEDPQRLPRGRTVELAFQINRLPFRVHGQVKTIRSETRVGFQFSHMDEHLQRRLEGQVEALIRNLVKRYQESTIAC
jgi:c-di-GMP-binding flagellar brake protein YcgR